jgi:hypothetical protein
VQREQNLITSSTKNILTNRKKIEEIFAIIRTLDSELPYFLSFYAKDSEEDNAASDLR